MSTVLIRTLMDERYFYGIRMMATNALVNCAIPELDFIGKLHLLKAFQHLFCFEGSPMTRSNDFSDQRSYNIQCTIPKALSRIRDSRGKAPKDVKWFFIEKLKFNDNSSNEVCSIIMLF
jgi:transcription initiation factor TFIID subunit 2